MMISNIKPAEPPPIKMRLPNIGDIISDIKFGWLREAGRWTLPASDRLFLDGDAVFNVLHAFHTFGQGFSPALLRTGVDEAA
jgi:hypothetical protein